MDRVLAYSRDYNRDSEDAPDRAVDTIPMHKYARYRVHFHFYTLNFSLGREAIKEFSDNNSCGYHIG